MIETFRNILKIPDLRKRIVFTFIILALARVGAHIITPGINTEVLAEQMRRLASGTLFGLYDLFAGGAFRKAAVFGLGIMPYISASIIFQLLGAVVPQIQRLQQSGEEGRKKITQYTRYATLGLSAMQAFGVAILLESMPGVVVNPGLGFKLLTMISMATGTMLLMWLGEQIDDRGIGNGISLLIFVGIIARLPAALANEWLEFTSENRDLLTELVLLAIGFGIIYALVALTQAQRKIPVQYAKRVVGRKIYGGVNTHFPLRVNTAGVMPIIFAQAIMFIPSTLFNFFPDSDLMITIRGWFSFESLFYWVIYGLLIIFFTYFYTAIILNPVEVANNLKKQGGFIPGVRPGKQTAEYLDNILTRVTLPGSIALALVAIIPYVLVKVFHISYAYASFFGGTGLLIIVGVALDFIQQVESHLYMRHYEGFSRGGRIRGRR
ncbi:MAG: preprotein translocase subunit SecY [Calditrichaeota bacterium]|nr:MAG: preprotein translocase subunit SecY [Calditrichota bacterium]